MESLNSHKCMKYYVVLSFVSQDHQDGYQKTTYEHCETKYEAAVKATAKFMDTEIYPIQGVAVYECVLAY